MRPGARAVGLVRFGCVPLPPPEVTAFADQLEAALTGRALAGVGRVDLGPEGSLPDAELAARAVLADLDHLAYLQRTGVRVRRAEWDHLAEQLRRLLGYAAAG